MMRLRQFYARRVVNVNVNIVLSGLGAMILTVIPVHVTRYFDFFEDHQFRIVALTLIADLVFDFILYYALHWVANHMPRRGGAKGGAADPPLDAGKIGPASSGSTSSGSTSSAPARPAPPPGQLAAHVPFLKDASAVQIERAVLSPILYLFALGTQYGLLHGGWPRELATFVGYAVGITVARFLHTIWMLRRERRAMIDLSLCPSCGASLTGVKARGAKVVCRACGAMTVMPPVKGYGAAGVLAGMGERLGVSAAAGSGAEKRDEVGRKAGRESADAPARGVNGVAGGGGRGVRSGGGPGGCGPGGCGPGGCGPGRCGPGGERVVRGRSGAGRLRPRCAASPG